jgi:cell surface protein SprA
LVGTPLNGQFIFGLSMVFFLCLGPTLVYAQRGADTTKQSTDTVSHQSYNPFRPTYRPSDRYGDPFSNQSFYSPLFLKDPKSLNLDLQIDTGMNYSIYEKIGKVNFRPTSSMSFQDFNLQQSQSMLTDYWKGRSKALDGESAVSSRNILPKIYVSPVMDRIFGGSYVELIPRGFVTLDFGANFQKIANPSIPIRQQKNGGFQFDQNINLSVVGKIGEKMKVTTNFDNNNSFDFQNNMKVEYTGNKEDVLKKFEIGNVSLPLNNSLISGAQNLFGVKAQMQFGKLSVTTIAATQRGKQSTINIQGGPNGAAQGRPFEIVGSSYDENRNFFLGQFFRDNYERWLSTIPQITSGINVTRVEIYVLNRKNDTQTLRDVVGFMDMAESNRIYRKDLFGDQPAKPNDNNTNDLFTKLKGISAASAGIEDLLTAMGLGNGTDFEKITSARKLATTEYTLNSQLGYITLQSKLQNDEALAVAYQYTYNGRVYTVGELSEDYANKPPTDVVYLKLLRPRAINIKDKFGVIIPTWNLMMKNIYNLNVTSVAKDGFQLRVIYRDDRTGIDNPQLQEGSPPVRAKQLITALGLDKLNPYNDPQPDGNFDFVDKVTINADQGLIIFPYLEPFNSGLRDLFALDTDPSEHDYLINKYVYDTLYHTTLAEAALVATKNKFFITGSFKSGSGKDIIIQGFNISQGSVKVYAGGTPLKEGTDYTVDYTFGKVTILNEGILSSGQNISITYEQQDPFSFQTRSLLGTRLDYKLTDDINLGSTFLYYDERPLISRNLIGNEPARNMMYGFDVNAKKNSRVLTKMVDALPFIQTKEASTVTFNAEFAQLRPGTSNLVQGTGTSFIDDFENTATPYSLISPIGWKLATTPKTLNNQFDPSLGAINDVRAGYKRAKLAWYFIDNLFYTQSYPNRPNIPETTIDNNHYIRPVGQQEIFPYRDPYIGNFYEPILNLAYYPSERGPYNYNPKLNSDGSLTDPSTNWGGITTAVRTEVDFDKANIEYIEFWLLDPFINSPNGTIDDGIHPPQVNTTGGQLVFHLGSISEDIMHDGEHAFENGLPINGVDSASSVTENNWGFVTKQQFVNNAFNTDPATRANQDVGMDGTPTSKEPNKFSSFIRAVPAAAQAIVTKDPSADDFKYFLGGDLDTPRPNGDPIAGVLERYKNINGTENNSPVLTGNEPYAASGTTIPDNEDINQDNTLSDLDEYYTYNIDLKPGKLQVGNKYIVDKITPAVASNKDNVTWYLFRVPIRNFDDQVGDITGFKTIRYIRMFLTGFTQPVVLRLANFRSVGNRWRAYEGNLQQATFGPPLEPNLDNFTVSAVSVEDNGQGNAIKPPYIEPLPRDRDNTSVVQRRLNEQSVQLCATGLPDGDARAIYKNASLDFFNYHHIKMFMSAHGAGLLPNQVTGFLRLGTDFDQNYYEIEVPLTPTDPNDPNFAGNNRDAKAVATIWPVSNQIDLDLDELYALKVARDREGFPLNELYPRAGPKVVGHHNLRIYGRPDMSQVKLMMIGIRNPRGSNSHPVDVCLWADEMRLTDFDRTPGWAVNSVLTAKLADLGSVTASLKHTTFGFGGIQSKISERTRATTTIYNISTTLNLDKLFPKSFGLKMPMFASFQSTIIDPNYDPANPDVRIKAALESFATTAEQQAYLKIIQDYTFQRSLNFTNVRKVKTDPKARSNLWDIENFAFTYAYTDAKQRNFNLIENTKRNVKGAVAWQYTSKFKGVEPFKEMKFLSSPFLQLIKDFNFNPFPSNISVRGELERSFSKIVYRNNVQDPSGTIPNWSKYFVFNRYYTARWNISKSLSVDYNAKVNAIIDEPDGDIDTREKQDQIITNLRHFGRMKYFEQTITTNYTLPLDKFPVTNWLGADYRYNVGYNWKAGPLATADTPDSLRLGNIIQNTQDQSLTGRVDLVKFYNKIGFLKDINSPRKKPTVAELSKHKSNRPDTLKTPPDLGAVKGLLRLLMSVRNINGTYNITQGTILPGFDPSPFLFGLDKTRTAPGWGFVLGQQDPYFAQKAAQKGWLTHSSSLTTPFSQTQQKDLSLKTSIEPLTDIKIQLDIKKNSTTSFQEIFRDTTGAGVYSGLSPSRSGSYRISAITIRTAFKNNSSLNSTVFQQFSQNINIIKNRFNNSNQLPYESQSQDVLIPAFIAAYTGKSADHANLSPFPNIPLPNWRIDFTGLNKIPALAELFQSITLNHAYTSTYSVANYTNSLEYSNVTISDKVENYNRGQFASITDPTNGQVVPIYVITTVMFSEQFAPLVGISVRTKKKLSVKFEYKTRRDISLTVSNSQVTELNNKEWTMEVGYSKNNFRLPFKDHGRIITLKNDLTFKMTVGVASNEIIQRGLDAPNTVTSGNVNFQFRPNVNYAVNKKLNLQFYIDRNVNNPLVTNSYRRATTQVGTKLLFNLAQ